MVRPRGLCVLLVLAAAVAAADPPREGNMEPLRIDEALGGRPRPFGRFPDTIRGGPTGARVWANYFDTAPGISGRIHILHAANAPDLFTLDVSTAAGPVAWASPDHVWYPSHLRMTHTAPSLRLEEAKWFSWDDCAVDCLTLANTGDSPIAVTVRLRSSVADKADGEALIGRKELYGATMVFTCAATQPGLAEGTSVTLAPGKTWSATIGCTVTVEGEEAGERRLAAWLGNADPLAEQGRQYQAWFDRVPVWASSDPDLDAVWAYRWYLARRNLADPRLGLLRRPLFYEGRGHKVSPDAWAPDGWDFSKLISFAACWHVLENRWYPDTAAARGEVETLIASQRPDGRFGVATVDRAWGNYTDLVAWAVWGLHCVAPDRAWLATVVDGLRRNVDGWSTTLDPDGDGLPTVANHNHTGKEYQPSYFESAGFPCGHGKENTEPLERVDAASYLHANARALAAILRELGKENEAERYDTLADKVAQAVRGAMWDTETGFFHDLRERDGARTRSLNVVGFDPFFAAIAGPEHEAALTQLANPATFAAPWPVPSTAMDGPAYAPNAWWFDHHPKGPHGAMWNGPTWPYTNTTVLLSVARATRMLDHRYDGLFADLLRRYTRLHFRGGDRRDPCLFEHYRPDTGAAISQEEDYYHSGWIDLVVTGVCGLVPRNDDTLELDPIDVGLDWFRVANLPYRGHTLTISWRGEGASAPEDMSPGFGLVVDGNEVARSEGLERVTARLR